MTVSCDSHPLSDYEEGPIYTLDFLNNFNQIEYYFLPIVRIIESDEFVTDVKITTSNPPEMIRGKNLSTQSILENNFIKNYLIFSTGLK